MPICEHAPFNRAISDESTATDRQWARMLKEVFDEVDGTELLSVSPDTKEMRLFLSIIGIVIRNSQ